MTELAGGDNGYFTPGVLQLLNYTLKAQRVWLSSLSFSLLPPHSLTPYLNTTGLHHLWSQYASILPHLSGQMLYLYVFTIYKGAQETTTKGSKF